MAQPHRIEAAADPILQRVAARHPKTIDLSLDRLRVLLDALGNPETALPPVVHIAGTNGKGSVGAFLGAMLAADGQRAHRYTSPHLVRFHERIRLGTPGGSVMVDDAALAGALETAERALGDNAITFFEITTAAAFVLFAQNPADILVLETGLGGRLDATNVVERPLVSVITPIGLDHQDFLGDTVADIAGEKAGIIKRGVPVVSAPQRQEAAEVLERVAARLDAPLSVGGTDYTAGMDQGRFVYQDERGLIDLAPPRLVGRHQYTNAGTAIAAARVARLLADPTSIEAGLLQADWPGRMQRLTRGRLLDFAPAGAELWVDGGHNADAGEALASTLADLEDRVSRPLFLIVGMVGSKDASAFLRPFAGLTRHVFCVRAPAETAHEPGALAQFAEAMELSAEPVASVKTALRLLQENWRFEPPPRILICGSLYLVGDVLSQNGTPPE